MHWKSKAASAIPAVSIACFRNLQSTFYKIKFHPKESDFSETQQWNGHFSFQCFRVITAFLLQFCKDCRWTWEKNLDYQFPRWMEVRYSADTRFSTLKDHFAIFMKIKCLAFYNYYWHNCADKSFNRHTSYPHWRRASGAPSISYFLIFWRTTS